MQKDLINNIAFPSTHRRIDAASLLNSMASFKIDLCIVRHGETTANAANILQGHSNYTLSASGTRQAELLGDYFAEVEWDYCLSSDLIRAESTAQIILSRSKYCKNSDPSAVHSATATPLRLETTPLVREYRLGIRENLPTGTPISECRKIVSAKLGIPISEVVDDSETDLDVCARQRSFLEFLITKVSEKNKEKFKVTEGCDKRSSKDSQQQCVKVLLISHGGFIRSFLVNFFEYPDRIKLRNCSISKVQICKDGDSAVSYNIIDPVDINYVIPEIEDLSKKLVQEEL
jgi:broad specificity phosphatase PhoE